MTPAYLVECLMDAPEFHPEGSLGQALNDVLYGRSEIVDGEPRLAPPSDPSVLASFSIEDYSPGQRRILECLRLTPDGLATWLRRDHTTKPASPALGGGVPVSATPIEAEGPTGSDTKLTAEKHIAEADKRKTLSIAQSTDWYLGRIHEYTTKGIIPSRANDEQVGKAVGIPTTRVRELRAELAPVAWRKPGRRKLTKN
jgi:hypothetical protein